MFLLGFLLGLAVGFGLWIWQQVQLKSYLERVIQPLSYHADKIYLPLLPFSKTIGDRLRREISTAQENQQDLLFSLETYKQLLDLAPLGYLQVDEENQLLWCNRQAREILHLQKWQPGQVRLLLELVRSYELDQLIEQTRDWQKPQVREWVFHPSRDHSQTILELKPLALEATSLPLPGGQVGVFLENRQPLLDINQERDRSFSDLAHELRTPLTSIRLVAETLQTRLNPPFDRWANRLMQEVDRLINLVQSWLELTQMETNSTMLLHLETVEVRSLIASVWETLEPLAQYQNLHISYSGLENICIQADKSRMHQVFVNLLDNCIKYSLPDSNIHVEINLISVSELTIGESQSKLLELVRSYELDQLIEQTRDWQKPQVREWVFHPSRDHSQTILELKPLALEATSLPLPGGQVGVFLENRQPLLDINQERDRSFSDLAHELRTPLTSIRLVAETLQTRLNPPFDRWANRLMQEVDRLINLVQSWLELTQMETNSTMLLHLETVEVRSLIASVWETLEPLAQYQNLHISYSGLENICIQADKSRMHQVFVNLLDNCIKYSLPDSNIHVEINLISISELTIGESQSKLLEINIIDSGTGFAPIDLPHVFERFYRGDKARHHESRPENSETTAITGSGLGLAIVRQIILAHGGGIKAMNHPETGGAWIQIHLPEVMSNSPSQDYS